MSEFFVSPWSPSRPEQAEGGSSPPWTGRPQGVPPGAVMSESALARSEMAGVSIAYLDAFPEGFEFRVEASTVAVERVCRNGRDCDIFGRHWPMVGDSRDGIPPQLLRIGVQFADGRKATNITGCDRPVDGPTMSPLRGGGGGWSEGPGGPVGERSFHQGYWVSPLPQSGTVALVCEWPAVGIPLVRHDIDARLVLDAADRARAIFPTGQRVLRDGREWRLGTDADVEWISYGAFPGGAAEPPIFAAQCTLAMPLSDGRAELTQHERAVIELLAEQTEEQAWWLGYVATTGNVDVVFPYAPRVSAKAYVGRAGDVGLPESPLGSPVYTEHAYVLVEAGPEQAASWRDAGWLNWALPDLLFPADRSWLLSTTADLGRPGTSIGGSEQLVNSFLHHTVLGPRARAES